MDQNVIVNLKGVSIYQQQSLILDNVNLSIHKGEFTYLIGKTGSGKSSLLKTLYGALPLKKGKGKVAGFDLPSLNRKTIPLLRRKLGIVFQDFNLLTDRNVEQNLFFVLKATGWKDKVKMQTRINEVLEKVGLSDKKSKMPYEISGGEQQRIVFARALLNKPDLIIADEPTGNLDPDTSDDILLLLKQLAESQNTAVFFATHDYRILENFPARIVRCQNGRILDEENFLV
ncbi:MAG: ATP-binding cassette domain-containing protein [Bacteroidota bacterium]